MARSELPCCELTWKRKASRDLRALGGPEAERLLRALETRLLADPRGEPLRVPVVLPYLTVSTVLSREVSPAQVTVGAV